MAALYGNLRINSRRSDHRSKRGLAVPLNQAKGRECAERWCTSLSFVPEAAQNKKSFGFLFSSLKT